MTARFSVAIAAAALTLAGCGGGGSNLNDTANVDTNRPLPTINAPNNQDWTQVIQATPEGGYRMGNPDAPVKLVEYASISCPHCAEFTAEGATPLRERYVKSGQVSWEYRPVMLFPTDPGVFLLLRCQGAQPFFRLADQLYATQRDWITKIQQQAAALNGMAPQQQVGAMIRAGELDQFFRQRGMPAARVDSCLADMAGLQDMVTKSGEAANKDNVTGTPTFFINGQVLDGVGYWNRPGNPAQSLEPKLQAAIGS